MASKKRLNGSITAALVATAFSGLVAGSASAAPIDSSSTGIGNSQSVRGVVQTAYAFGTSEKEHSCKGQNDCKGQGGCKTGDNGCKGKNSCKGKGGCATDGSH